MASRANQQSLIILVLCDRLHLQECLEDSIFQTYVKSGSKTSVYSSRCLFLESGCREVSWSRCQQGMLFMFYTLKSVTTSVGYVHSTLKIGTVFL